jgi:hypothetical protein
VAVSVRRSWVLEVERQQDYKLISGPLHI